MSKKGFPKLLYVKRENEGTKDEFLDPTTEIAGHAQPGESVTVAVYRLERLAKITAKVEQETTHISRKP